MCAKCRNLQAAGMTREANRELFPKHKPESCVQPPLEQRQAEMRKRIDSARLNVSVHYASNDVRRARIRKIRENLGLTCAEFAAEFGMPESGYKQMECGTYKIAMVYVLMAEKILKSKIVRRSQEKRKIRERLAAAGIDTQPVQVEQPDNPDLRRKVITLKIQGNSIEDIARTCALRPETVELWVKSIG